MQQFPAIGFGCQQSARILSSCSKQSINLYTEGTIHQFTIPKISSPQFLDFEIPNEELPDIFTLLDDHHINLCACFLSIVDTDQGNDDTGGTLWRKLRFRPEPLVLHLRFWEI